jgi:hypothetical protein
VVSGSNSGRATLIGFKKVLKMKKNSIQLVLHKIDIFGVEPKLSIYGQERYTTGIGGFLSLLFFGISIFLFISLGADMFFHKSPVATTTEIFQKTPGLTKIGPNNDYFFIFGLQRSNDFQHYYDPSIYKIVLKQNYDQIPLERCTEKHLPNDNEELKKFFQYGHHSKLDQLLCIKKENATDFKLSGDFVGGNYKFIEINLYPCQNSSEPDSIICKPWEVIESYLYTGYFAFYSVDSLIDVSNYVNPIKKVGLDFFTEIGLTMQRSINRYLRSNKVTTDDGWIIKENRTEESTSHVVDRETFSLIKPENIQKSLLLRFIVRKSLYEKQYERTYMKIQQVLAYMGGFLNIMFYGLLFLSTPFVKKNFNDRIINTLFDFEEKPLEDITKGVNKEEGCSDSSQLSIEQVELTITNKFNEKEEGVATFRPNSQENPRIKPLGSTKFQENGVQKRLINNTEKPLLLSYSDLVKGKLFKYKKFYTKYRQRKKAIQAINQRLDLSNILNKLSEIDKIKMIILDEDQFSLFDYLPKPVIQTNERINFSYKKERELYFNKRSFLLLQHEEVDLKTLEAQKAFKNILNKKELSPLDLKLISLLSEEIKFVMNNGKVPSLLRNLDEKQRKKFKELTNNIEPIKAPNILDNSALEKKLLSLEENDISQENHDILSKIYLYK